MTAASTPGPWTYDYDNTEGEVGFRIMTADNAVVARVWADEERGIAGPIVEANARKISATLELYDALIGLFRADFNEDTRPYWDKARAALNKAEGKAS